MRLGWNVPARTARNVVLSFLVLGLLMATSCTGGLSGKYESEAGISMEFESGGKVLLGTSILGISNVVELDYKVDGDNLKLTSPQGTIVYKILADGSIEGPLGVHLKKK